MEVYAGLILVAFGLAYLMMRVIKPGAASGVTAGKVAGPRSAQPKSHTRKQNTFGRSSAAGSRFKRPAKPMTMARGATVPSAGVIRKPWGW